jgi:L-2-hydroxyglutarate oxidase
MLPNGALVGDFLLVDDVGAIHVLNAPSPAATACLAIGEVIAERAVARMRVVD